MDSTSRRTRPTPEEIRARAYEIYLDRGGRPGDPEADWLRAERELAAAAPDPGTPRDGKSGGKTGHDGDGARAPAAFDDKQPQRAPEVVVKRASAQVKASSPPPMPAKAARTNSRGKGKPSR